MAKAISENWAREKEKERKISKGCRYSFYLRKETFLITIEGRT